jgi:hypothetical protein
MWRSSRCRLRHTRPQQRCHTHAITDGDDGKSTATSTCRSTDSSDSNDSDGVACRNNNILQRTKDQPLDSDSTADDTMVAKTPRVPVAASDAEPPPLTI